jgi:hypothetical protein
VAVAAAAASAAETIATATNRTERSSRTIDGALRLKRPIHTGSNQSALTIVLAVTLVPFPTKSETMLPIDVADAIDEQQIKLFPCVINHLDRTCFSPPYCYSLQCVKMPTTRDRLNTNPSRPRFLPDPTRLMSVLHAP